MSSAPCSSRTREHRLLERATLDFREKRRNFLMSEARIASDDVDRGDYRAQCRAQRDARSALIVSLQQSIDRPARAQTLLFERRR